MMVLRKAKSTQSYKPYFGINTMFTLPKAGHLLDIVSEAISLYPSVTNSRQEQSHDFKL